MRKGWKKGRLGDVMNFRNGKKRPNVKGTFPIYGGNGILDYTNGFNYKSGVIIGRVGAYCGSVFYEPNKHWVSDNAISAVSNEKSDLLFCYYLLNSLQLNKRQIGTSQPLLTQEILNSIEIHLPPLVEQKTIASILSCLENKIALNTKINHHLTVPIYATDSSPDISRGKRASRRVASFRFSAAFLVILSKLLRSILLKSNNTLFDGISVEIVIISVGLIFA